jgi:ADP-heptose:LPS heptosyltransferase
LRSLFYNDVSCSPDEYAKLNKVHLPLNYVDRDFVVLTQLGVQRSGRSIEMKITDQGKSYQSKLRARLESAQLVLGLNIGCGTPGAGHKKPDLYHLASCWAKFAADKQFVGLLTGAPNESELNEDFVKIYKTHFDSNSQWINLAGDCNISEFTGLIASCDLFVSTDSGPYHMAVALKVPTLAWFVEGNEEHFHYDAWCQCLVNPDAEMFANHAQRLLDLN